jgi:hypothetical protein
MQIIHTCLKCKSSRFFKKHLFVEKKETRGRKNSEFEKFLRIAQFEQAKDDANLYDNRSNH